MFAHRPSVMPWRSTNSMWIVWLALVWCLDFLSWILLVDLKCQITFTDNFQLPPRITQPGSLSTGYSPSDIIRLCIGTFTVVDVAEETSFHPLLLHLYPMMSSSFSFVMYLYFSTSWYLYLYICFSNSHSSLGTLTVCCYCGTFETH